MELTEKHKNDIEQIIRLICSNENDKGFLLVDRLKQHEKFGIVTEWCDHIFTEAYKQKILLTFSGPFWNWNYPVLSREEELKPEWFNSVGDGKTVKPKFYLFWDKSENVIEKFEESKKQISRNVIGIIT